VTHKYPVDADGISTVYVVGIRRPTKIQAEHLGVSDTPQFRSTLSLIGF